LNKRYLPILKKRNPESIQNCLDEFQKSWEDLNQLTQLNNSWNEVIGNELSRECKPLKIEKKILIIGVNHPQWRQALIYNRHKLIETIRNIGINLKEIKIIQNYEESNLKKTSLDPKKIWENHPCRVKSDGMVACKFCNIPSPKGEILRWGKCIFCWRKNN